MKQRETVGDLWRTHFRLAAGAILVKTTSLAALAICGSLVCGPAEYVLAGCDGECGVTGCGTDDDVRHGHGARASTAARTAHGYGVVAHFPSDGTPLLLPRCTGAHGTLYGRPYNYRNLLDYPWHAPLRGVKAPVVRQAPVPAVPPQPAGEDSHFEPPAAPEVESFDTAWIRSTDSSHQSTRLQFVR
jgi:hypothetical protein